MGEIRDSALKKWNKEKYFGISYFFNFGDLDLCKEVDLHYISWN